MDYFPILFNSPLKRCYVGLWVKPMGTPLAISSCLAPAHWQVKQAGIAGSTALSLPAAACPWCGCCGWDLATQLFPADLCRCVFSLQAKWKSWGHLLNECPCSSHPPCESCFVALVESWLRSSCGRCLCARLGRGWRWSISSSSWCPSSSPQLSSPSITAAAIPCCCPLCKLGAALSSFGLQVRKKEKIVLLARKGYFVKCTLKTVAVNMNAAIFQNA